MAFLLWITGLSGSGKTTIAKKVFKKVKKKYINTILIDGDEFRKISTTKFGYTRSERLKAAFAIAKFCKFLTKKDINVICSTISLFKEIHSYNRKTFKNYFEIYINCTMDELIKRDKKKLYTRALSGEVHNIVGVDIPFDKPNQSHLVIDNTSMNLLTNNVSKIIDNLEKNFF